MIRNFRRGYRQTSFGQIHFRSHGRGRPVLCLHQSPQSSAEFDDVLAYLGQSVQAIAMDTIGFGHSDRVDRALTMDEYCRSVLEFVDALELDEPVSLAGVHTGASIAAHVAARAPARVSKLILSGPVLLHPDGAKAPLKAPVIVPRFDGMHLVESWQSYWALVEPVSDIRAFQRLYVNSLAAGDEAQQAYGAVYSVDTLSQLRSEISAPTLVIWGDRDLVADGIERCRPLIPHVRQHCIKGGTLNTLIEYPKEWSDVVAQFITT